MSKYCRYKSAIYVRTPGKIESINTKYCTYVLNYTNSHPKFSPPPNSNDDMYDDIYSMRIYI